MTSRWQISAGELTVWLTPLLYAFAALASAWVLHDARRRRFPLYAVAAWALATLVYAPVVLPFYVIARIFKPRPPAADALESTSIEQTDPADDDDKEAAAADPEETTGATPGATRGGMSDEAGDAAGDTAGDAAGDTAAVAAASPVVRAPFRLTRYAAPLLYAFALLSTGAIYFYRDYHSFDAHLARAANARLLNRRDAAIREYRAALRLVDDAHTHKLLAIQLAEAGQIEAALAELRAAERGGAPDEHLPLRIALTLDALGRPAEAVEEYRRFLRSGSCARPSPDERCADAAARVP